MVLAGLIDAIPVVQNTADRIARFASPALDQRVFNKATGNIERWTGAVWTADFVPANPSGAVNAGNFARGTSGITAADNAVAVNAAIAAAPGLGATSVFIPASLIPFTGSLVASNPAIHQVAEGGTADVSVFSCDAYGVPGDGVTDCTAQLQVVENLRGANTTLKLTPGRIYVSTAATGATMLRTASIGQWECIGSTLKYTGATTEPLGSEGAALSLLHILHNNFRIIEGTFDCGGKLLAAFGVWDQVTQGPTFGINTIIKSLYEGDVGRLSAPGVKYFVSKDVTGATIAGRALNVSGKIIRPDCPVTSNKTSVTGHASLSCDLVGGNLSNGNSSGDCVVGCPNAGGDAWATFLMVPHQFAVPTSIPFGPTIGNDWLGDWLMHDATVNVVEKHGTSLTNSAGFNVPSGFQLGDALKEGAVAVIAHGNLGSDGSFPDAWMGATGAGQAFMDMDPPVTGAVGGGRVIEKMISPTEAVLVSGIDASTCNAVFVTLTAARLVGAPLNPRKGQRVVFKFKQGGAGAFAVTWNAVFAGLTWSDAGNVTGAFSSVEVEFDGTNWSPTSAQAPYHA